MKSIRGKITATIIILVICLCVIFGVASCYLNYRTAMSVLEENMQEISVISSEQVALEIQRYKDTVAQIGLDPSLTGVANSEERKNELLLEALKSTSFTEADRIASFGASMVTGADLSGEAYFAEAMKGNVYITDPFIDPATGKVKIIVSAPIWMNGKKDTEILGVVAFSAGDELLNNIISQFSVGQTGGAYMLDSYGNTIAAKDSTTICIENTQREAQGDYELKPLAEMEAKMCAGKSGFSTYTYHGVTKVAAYAPVAGTNGWSIAATAKRDEFLGQFQATIWLTFILAVAFILAGIVTAGVMGGKITLPIRRCVERLVGLSEGDLHSPVPEIHTQDETGTLAKVTEAVVKDMNSIVADLSHLLSDMSGGNLDVRSKADYHGDFAPIRTALRKILDELNQTMAKIYRAANQVSSGADQTAGGAQSLAQGSTEQASSVQELSANITEISVKVKDNAVAAAETSREMEGLESLLLSSNQQMERMIDSMGTITDHSNEIRKVIKTIEDIAFQTNILALNAAVEAARAGAAGKGFAVVADEVRSLANKSQEAVKNTADLIGGTIGAVEQGKKLADETGTSLRSVVDGVQGVTGTVARISKASGEQAQSITQVSQGIDQISSVIQTNSATAQQSAATSQELSGQAQLLKELITRFHLREEAMRDIEKVSDSTDSSATEAEFSAWGNKY